MKTENGLGNMIVVKQNSNEGVYIPDNLTQNLCLILLLITFTSRTEPLQSFFWKNKIKKKKTGITPTNDLAFQHNHTYIIHPCIILRLWGMLQVVDISQMCQVPTWNSFNSLWTKRPPATLCETLQLSPTAPTKWTRL